MLPKTKGHIIVLLAFLLLLGMIVSPVCAAQYTPRGDLDFWMDTVRESYSGGFSYSYVAPIGESISTIQFTVDTGQRVDFILYYGGNKTVTGSAENSVTSIGLCGFLPCPKTTSIVTLDGVSKSYEYGDIMPAFDFDIAGYGIENGTQQMGFLVYDGNYGKYDNDLAVFYPVDNISVNLISQVDISGSQTFSLYVNHGKSSKISDIVHTGITETIGEWVAFLLAIGEMGKIFIINLIVWLRFLFIDNLLLTVALYIGVSMAYSAISTPTRQMPFGFFKRFIGFQRSMFDFMVSFWQTMVGLISQIITSVGSAWPIVGGLAIGAAVLLLVTKFFG